uniref:Uncharacterized protein LOC104238729 n=1 Tax=Nicotiana sylvestris TaxID=4096 RepID=A0A1U7XHH0_NICSY|nr:PREDICTED: uncharacterized protein LOC104238729 [Nicotiana sylvestris]
MKATEMEGAELASYRLRGVAYLWFEMWEDSRGEGRPPARWDEFVDAFMDNFLPAKTMAARDTEFEVLKQGSMSVWKYHMEFVRLSKYAPQLVSTMDARVRRFVQGLSPLVVNEASTVALHSDMNYGKIVGFAQATEVGKLKIRAERESGNRARSAGYSGRPIPGRGPSGSSQSYAQSSASALPSMHSYQQGSHLRSGSDSRRPHHSDRPGGESLQQGRSSFPKCGSQGMDGGFAQSSGSSVATSSVHPPAPAGRSVVRGGAHGRGVSSRFYTLSGCQSAKASPDVATGILSVQAIDCYALIDWGSSLSYVTPFIASCFGVEPEQLHESYSVSTPIGDSITTARVYRNCIVIVCGRATTADLIDLEMHLGKANVVADALSRKSLGSLAHLGVDQKPLAWEVYQLASLGVRISTSDEGKVMVRNGAESSLVAEVKEKQLIDPALAQMKEAVLNNKTSTFSLGGEDSVLRCQGRLCVTYVDNLRGRIMAEAHNSRGMADFVSKCPNYQQVKAEHQRPNGLTQLVEIPMWKWEMINMDFMVGLPRTQRKFNSIWVIGDRLTKSAHFLPVKSTDTGEQYAQLYIKEIVNLSTVFHPQTNGQAEQTIQTLEDMLRACVLDFKAQGSPHPWLQSPAEVALPGHPFAQFAKAKQDHKHQVIRIKG